MFNPKIEERWCQGPETRTVLAGWPGRRGRTLPALPSSSLGEDPGGDMTPVAGEGDPPTIPLADMWLSAGGPVRAPSADTSIGMPPKLL